MPDDPLKGAEAGDSVPIDKLDSSSTDEMGSKERTSTASSDPAVRVTPLSEGPPPRAPARHAKSQGGRAPDGPEIAPGAEDGGIPAPEFRHELLKECEALVLFLGRYGSAFADADGMPERTKALVELVARLSGRIPSPEEWKELVLAYSEVTKVTYARSGVHGRSVLDTWGSGGMFGPEQGKPDTGRWDPVRSIGRWSELSGRRRRPLRVAVQLGLTALALQWLVAWAGRISDPKALSWLESVPYAFATDLAPLVIPAAWGGLGACIFLMKKLSDKLSDFAFEEARLKGDGTRIFLGAILGVAVVQIFFPTYSETMLVGDVPFGPTTAAFVAGLGVKPIYAAFEAVSEGIAERIASKKKTVG